MLLSRADGRDRVAVPFWNGVLSALGAAGIGVAVLLTGGIAIGIAVTLATGHPPKLDPGGLPLTAMAAAFYAAMGVFGWRRLRTRQPFRALSAGDGRALLAGVAAVLLVQVATALELVLTHQTQHVQAGFEHFSVKASAPALTVLDVALNVLVLVVLAPLVEEIVFRGLLFGALAQRLGVLLAALVSALLFGLTHGDAVLFPSLAAVGLINALLYARTGNLTTAVVLHALNNALGAALLIAASLRPG